MVAGRSVVYARPLSASVQPRTVAPFRSSVSGNRYWPAFPLFPGRPPVHKLRTVRSRKLTAKGYVSLGPLFVGRIFCSGTSTHRRLSKALARGANLVSVGCRRVAGGNVSILHDFVQARPTSSGLLFVPACADRWRVRERS